MTLPTLLLAACAGSPDPETLRSAPTEPTVDLAAPAAQTVTWSTLEGLLEPGAPALPAALGGLALGQPEAEARAALAAVRHDKLVAPEDRVHEGITVTSARLRDLPQVGVSLLLKGGVVDQIDLSLPGDEALFAVQAAWGDPTGSVPAEPLPRPTWDGPGLRVTLSDAPEGLAILKFERRE